ncbi:glycoside hydrolase family 79 protein [Paxillus involutus ATCC 200175]|uniref:Glycoside hydrolase family 79 protein n=1 Tax=Paxillus involutus ATCC 200175 TaxID=664439 RepID=A0A0C9SQ55_PAXIN|nr:glycoside hydrolase family 79 protein [Paxillus involutus ATCC 200175]
MWFFAPFRGLWCGLVGSVRNLNDVLSGGLLRYPYKYYTLQHYPTYICNGPTPSNTNISYFLSHTNVPGYAQWQSTGIEMAKNVNVPVLMTEYNSVSCGGSNVSDTFAATLWAVDAALNFASAGLSGAYLHTREYQVLYNLFDPPTPSTSTESGWHTGSPYYSALFLSETFIPGGSIVVDINLNNSINDPASTVAGYAIYNANGTACERLVLINYGLTGQLRNFTLPQNVTPSIGFRILVAPSVEEKTDISWAGQTIGQNGDLEGTQTTGWVECGDGCTVGVPGPGAALILFGDYANATGFFVGNSTIAGLNGYAPSPTGTSGAEDDGRGVWWRVVGVVVLVVTGSLQWVV